MCLAQIFHMKKKRERAAKGGAAAAADVGESEDEGDGVRAEVTDGAAGALNTGAESNDAPLQGLSQQLDGLQLSGLTNEEGEISSHAGK